MLPGKERKENYTRSQDPYFVSDQEELKVLEQDGRFTDEGLCTDSYVCGSTTPRGARGAQVALPVTEQNGACAIRHKTLVRLQEFPGTFDISYGEEAFCLDWVLKVISSLNSYQNQVVDGMEKLAQNLSTVDREVCDELHRTEFCNLNASEGYKSCKRLRELQQKRRAIKNSFEMLDTVQVVVSGVSKIEKVATDPAKKSYTSREPKTFIHDRRGRAFLLSLSALYEALLFVLVGGNIVLDIKKRKDLPDSTAHGLITGLLELPMDAHVLRCRGNNMYLHVEADNSVVCLNHSDLDRCCKVGAL